jgi:hypothetical protein
VAAAANQELQRPKRGLNAAATASSEKQLADVAGVTADEKHDSGSALLLQLLWRCRRGIDGE